MKTKLYVQMSKYDWDNNYTQVISSRKLETGGNQTVIDVCERIIDLNIPVIDDALLRDGEVEHLRAKIQEEMKESIKLVKTMNARIATLLCLESKPFENPAPIPEDIDGVPF